jgi:glycosyltransferase involved in cell wall biosynthesis
MDISIIIPTHNRAGSLVEAIQSAMALDYPADRYETIVVDNASTDDTCDRVENLRKTAGRRGVLYVREEELGLHYARHAGARRARGKVLVFTDDDAIFSPRWLNAYAEAFESHPEMVAAGGPVRPEWQAPPPKWLLDFIDGRDHFGPLSIMEPFQDFQLSSECYFFGVNMAVRREILFKVGGFNPELIGSFTVGDGESGLLRKLQKRKWLIGYVPDAVVNHRIPQHRMTLTYLRRWQAHLAGAQLYAHYHRHMPGYLKLFIDLLKTAGLFSVDWLMVPRLHSKTSHRSINIRLRAALGYAQIKYILRLISNEKLRQVVTRENWLESSPSTQLVKNGFV